MNDNLKVSTDRESDAARHFDELPRNLVQPKVQTRPLDTDHDNDFWAHFGADKQPGNATETKSNS